MIKALVFGACGRMGSLVVEELDASGDIELAAAVERPGHPQVGGVLLRAPIFADGGEFPESDVWIDFSLAAPALRHAEQASRLQKPIVIAATGFDQEEQAWLGDLANNCPLLLAPNLSMGMGAMEELVAIAGRFLGGAFDAVISELHHFTKRDAPSGTAERLADRVGEFAPNPPVVSQRAGGAVGEHTVRFVGAYEELVVTHRAWSRRAFSSGVVPAVRFIVGREPGMYRMSDVLKRF